MVSKVERTVGARIVFDTDERSVLSAFKTVVTEVLDDDGSRISSTQRDVDLDPREVSALFGAKIDAHLTETNAAKAAAEATLADAQREIEAKEAVIVERDEAIAAKEAERRAVVAELDQLKSEVEPV